MNSQLDSKIRATFDEIVARTPDVGDRPTQTPVSITSSPSAPTHPWLAAAMIAALGVGGLVAIRSMSLSVDRVIPAATLDTSSTLPASTPAAQPTEADPTSTTLTTEYGHSHQGVAVGSVVCVDAGASDQAVALCREEFGAPSIEALTHVTRSFVMAVNDNFASIADAGTLAYLLAIEARPLDLTLLPALTEPRSDSATTYLVIGTSDIPYVP